MTCAWSPYSEMGILRHAHPHVLKDLPISFTWSGKASTLLGPTLCEAKMSIPYLLKSALIGVLRYPDLLTQVRRLPITKLVSRLDGRPGKDRKVAGEESPGSMDMRCRITSGGGNPRESATENVDRLRGENPAARVKRCGKSAPRLRQRRRHGKPHREQDRIGAARGAIPGSMSGSAARVGCSRRRATGDPEEWPSRAKCVLALRRTKPGLQAGWRDTGRSAGDRRAPHQFGAPAFSCRPSWIRSGP